MSGYQRVGIIGCGSIGSLHRDVMREAHRDRFRVVALSDEDPDAMAALRPEADERLFVDYRDLLEWPEVDAVVISTPPRDHFPMAVRALASGKHVFVEKPPALTVEQCHEMRRAASTAGRVLFMGFHARYNRVVSLARRHLAGLVVERCDVVYRENADDYHASGSWVYDADVSGGGVLMDSGVNVVSVLAETMPAAFPVTVTSAELRGSAGFAVETAALVGFDLASGGHGTLDMDWLSTEGETRRIEYVAGGRSYVLDLVLERLLRDGDALVQGREPGSARVDQRSEYERMVEDFAEHIAAGRSFTSTVELDFVHQAYQPR